MIKEDSIKQILDQHGRTKSAAIPVLQSIQKEYAYLPKEALELVASNSDITPAEMYGIASFYSQFRLEAVGENMIKVCVGTACHVKGAGLVHDAFKRHLKLEGDQHTDASGKYTLEKVTCLGCCTIAPVVQINDITYGYVSTEQIEDIIYDFENRTPSKSKSYRKSTGEEIEGEIRIGLGSCCVASGSDDIRKEIESHIGQQNVDVKLKNVGCVGMCHQVPLVEVVKDDQTELYTKVKVEDVKDIIRNHFKPKGLWNQLKSKLNAGFESIQYQDAPGYLKRFETSVQEKHIKAFLGDQLPIATEQRGVLSPLSFEEYSLYGGFEGLKTALQMTPDELIQSVEQSGIRGRGGGGFPSYKKWRLVADNEGSEKYLICNGDEGDPGAFMDRMLLESYPFRVIEGALIAAYAVGASEGYFYIRAEYPLAVQRIKAALDICKEQGVLGQQIMASSFSFKFHVVEGAGAFVCGEETALIASIEGRRGFPKIRPPYPAEKGLWGKPTLVNNTETLAQVPYILRHGAEKFAAIGTESSKGTKVFSLAGKIARGGLIEVPMGMTIQKVVEEIGGGIANGKSFKAVQIGGPSGGCIPHWLSDTQIDFESLHHHGAMMGSGGLVVLDEDDCMVDIARYFLSFTQEESCGKCTYCRVGTKRMLDILDLFVAGKAQMKDLEELEKLGAMVQKGSICGLGKTAPNPVLSSLKYFREEYIAHINGTCPSGKCTDLISYVVNDKCIGCTKCVQQCPVDAIPFTPYEKHHIDLDKCIKCDACKQVCPEDAIDVI
jgi:NADH:ubiquinone oxidoreductase subunit F (NADH-binding)/NADH:ubiquinone oxidoreductase subunit E/NAD-dependent dihydropyrimidine dehydrogenase PreA subunit